MRPVLRVVYRLLKTQALRAVCTVPEFSPMTHGMYFPRAADTYIHHLESIDITAARGKKEKSKTKTP